MGVIMMTVDCHSHTIASWDGILDPRRYIDDAVAAGLDAVIVTDHHTFEGVEMLRALDPPLRIISGVEVNTVIGEILVYFVEEMPPLFRPLEETVDWVHNHGGLAVVPHPYALTAIARIRPPACWRAFELVDAIEGVNARNESAQGDARAQRIAQRYGKPITAGSDAHVENRLGRAHLRIEPFADAAEFLANLPRAQALIRRRGTFAENMVDYVATTWRRYRMGLRFI
jgi:predicted metal-dependent phosphoesterase TrpH